MGEVVSRPGPVGPGTRPPPDDDGPVGYVVRPLPPNRKVVVDRLFGAVRRFPIHGLVEFDVERARAAIAGSQPPVSWTGFLIATLARAVARHPDVNARRAGNRVLYFDRVDIGATVERYGSGGLVLDITTVRDADLKSCAAISEELRRAKHGSARQLTRRGRVSGQVWRLPGPVRRSLVRAAGTRPQVAATFGPAVGVTSLGMFGDGGGWAIPVSPLTLIATVSGVVERPVVRDGRVVIRPMLPLTLTFDHAVVDGGPAARFVATLRELTETAAAFEGAPARGPR
jgi:pyruvate/2-oxoglutarate dehydrogenase complex dihydrolipoamide acyltransferase (E2) component